MKKILKEERTIEVRKRQLPYLFETRKSNEKKFVKPIPRRKLQAFENYIKLTEPTPEPEKLISREDEESSDSDFEIETGYNVDYLLKPSSDDEKEILAKPEFEGLWDVHKRYSIPTGENEEYKFQLKNATKMEKKILQKVLEKHKDGRVIKQVAAGKEFKAVGFYSKPSIIHFKVKEINFFQICLSIFCS